jgi:hypothetical protein
LRGHWPKKTVGKHPLFEFIVGGVDGWRVHECSLSIPDRAKNSV